jgi:hypothetical protein
LLAAAKNGAIITEPAERFRDPSIAALASPYSMPLHPWHV